MKSARFVFTCCLLVLPITAGAELGNAPDSTQELRLKFRDAPLESVLNYLSDAAGFIIDLQTTVKGKVTVWSNQPVTRDEALKLVTSALDNHGYAAVRNGRTLTIWNKEDARKRDLPVRPGNNPADIPKNHEMVTQIIPIRYVNAVQVSRDLQPLLPSNATMTANEGGNAIILTDTQASIHRVAEIIQAIDTAISSVSSIKVFPLRYGDAKLIAGVLKDLFSPQDSGRTGSQSQGQSAVVNTFQMGAGAPADFTGEPGAFGPGGGATPTGGAGPGGGSSGGTAPALRVVAIAEERSNAVVVNAPQAVMDSITHLVRQLDVNVQDVTELRVFRLKNADPQETADLVTSLFGDSNSSSGQDNRAQMQFGAGPFAGAFAGPGANTPRANAAGGGDQSGRRQQQNRVVAVADGRSGSVVVSAARELMKQIGPMILQLDKDPARKQAVFVFNAEHTDVQAIQGLLEGLFPALTTGSSRTSSSQQNSAGAQLSNRATQLQNQRSSRTGSSSGLGGGLGSGSGLGGSGSGSGGTGP